MKQGQIFQICLAAVVIVLPAPPRNAIPQESLLPSTIGEIVIFDDGMNELMTAVGKRSGYQVEEHWLQLSGVCADCRD